MPANVDLLQELAKKEHSMTLSGKKIAILATNGFEQAELEVPKDRLSKAGATVEVISLWQRAK